MKNRLLILAYFACLCLVGSGIGYGSVKLYRRATRKPCAPCQASVAAPQPQGTTK